MSELEPPSVDPAYREHLLAAAKAAAAWGRAHQAGWTGDVSPAGESQPEAPTAITPARAIPPAAVTESVQDLEPAPPELETPETDPEFEQEPAAPLWPRLRRLLVRIAVVGSSLVVIALLVIGARKGLDLWHQHAAQAKAAATALAAQPPTPEGPVEPRPAPKPVGRLSVTTTPTGAKVSVDGHAYGTTPLMINDLAPGTHTVVISSRHGVVSRTVHIDPANTTELSEAIADGWVRILCPFDLTVSENGHTLWQYDDIIKLPAGTHHLRFENEQMNYVSEQEVVVNPGGQTTISIVPPPTP